MLSIGAMGRGQGAYYVDLAREDYYLEGGEPPGQWVGQGSEALGLSGKGMSSEVAREEFLKLFAGRDAQGRALVQNPEHSLRKPGWDLTFSAPKSVSTVWAITDGETRIAIQEAHFAAVKSALVTMEEGATTRRGHGGGDKEAARLVIATFEHGTSRAQDPNLHTHALILNVGVREDGTTGTLESQHFYASKMTVGALYRAEFAKGLQELGFPIERDASSFRINGVPASLEATFSKRRAEIKAHLAANGRSSARAAAVAALATRQVKAHCAREELFHGWRETGHEHDFSLTEARQLQSARAPSARLQNASLQSEKTPGAKSSLTSEERAATLEQMLADGIETLSRDHSHFGVRDLLRVVAADAPGRGVGAEEIRAAVQKELQNNPNLIALEAGDKQEPGKEPGQEPGRDTANEARLSETRFTTRELWETEKTLLQDAEVWSRHEGHRVGQTRFLQGLLQTERRATLTARERDPAAPAVELSGEQRTALSYLTKKSGGLALVAGMAGTGKTFLLEAARTAWEAEGFKVIGAAVAGKAARGLEAGAGIPSSTVARLGWEWERGFDVAPSEKWARKVEWLHATWQIDGKTRRELLAPLEVPKTKMGVAWKYATWQISKKQRDFLDKQIERRARFGLDAKTVLVVDEAGMVGTRQMATLIAKAKEYGAKLVLTGEQRQIQAVEVGGPFGSLQKRLGASELTQILRQKQEWQRTAVKDFAAGHGEKALRAYQERDCFTVAPDRAAAQQSLINAWAAEGAKKPEQHLIFTGTRADASALNRLAQGARQRAGQLGFRRLRIGGENLPGDTRPGDTLPGDTVHEKDRVLFTKNSAVLGVDNGTTGTVRAVDAAAQTLTVRLDNGQETLIPCREYTAVQLGYALTTHKAQGVTVKNSYILCGGSMIDRELSYVQASRATDHTRFFSEEILVWNPETQRREEATLTELGRRMSRSREKDLAHDVVRPENAEPQPTQTPAQRVNPELQIEHEPFSYGF